MEGRKEGRSHEATPSRETLALWGDVSRTLEESNIVYPRSAATSLRAALSLLDASPDARRFVETYLERIVAALLGQNRIGQEERDFTEEALSLTVAIVIKDLREKSRPDAGESAVLGTLALLLTEDNTIFKPLHWALATKKINAHTMGKFKAHGGFVALARYLSVRVGTSQFPALDMALFIPPLVQAIVRDQHNEQTRAMECAVSVIVLGMMRFLVDATGDQLAEFPEKQHILHIIPGLWDIFQKLATCRRNETFEFFKLWREFALKLIASPSRPMAALRWDVLVDLIEASTNMRPPPKAFLVSGAGVAFINGIYKFSGSTTKDGYHTLDSIILYTRTVPDSSPETEGGGKKLTLFRCVLRSQQKWWFISEADEDQPGTDRDVDYYRRKQSHTAAIPPGTGWVTCGAHGIDPPPTLQALGLIVPTGEEFNTMEHELVKWAFKYGVIKILLRTSLEQDTNSRAVAMLAFIASMCNPETVNMLIELYPFGASALDVDGRLPLHTLLASHKIAVDAIEKHVTARMGIISDGIQPQSMDWRGTVASVLRANPNALECQDGKTHLYPFMLAAATPTVPLDTVYFLLCENPSIVWKRPSFERRRCVN